jgi:hypothetical protein
LVTNGLIWVIDTSITLGPGKLLSVLALDAYHYQLAGVAPGFQHVHCIAVSVSPSWTGERLADLLERVISVMGRPVAYLLAADIVARLPSCRLSDDHQPGIMTRNRVSTPRLSLFPSLCAHPSRSIPRSSTGILC